MLRNLMKPSPQTLEHSVVAPHMLLRCERQGDFPCDADRVCREGFKSIHSKYLNCTSWHRPVSEDVQASCSAASNARGATAVFTSLYAQSRLAVVRWQAASTLADSSACSGAVRQPSNPAMSMTRNSFTLAML